MSDICQKFKDKANLDKNEKIFYSYDDKVGFSKELTLEELINTKDKIRNKMDIKVFEGEPEIKGNFRPKSIICPECKENIQMNIKDYKINLYICKNEHKIDNILLDEFEEIQNIDLAKLKCDVCKQINNGRVNNNSFYKCLTCENNICL